MAQVLTQIMTAPGTRGVYFIAESMQGEAQILAAGPPDEREFSNGILAKAIVGEAHQRGTSREQLIREIVEEVNKIDRAEVEEWGEP